MNHHELFHGLTLNISALGKTIFHNIMICEYVDIMLIDSFIHNKMGITYGENRRYKNIKIKYENELAQVQKYRECYNVFKDCFEIKLYMSKSNLGRNNPVNHLSQSVFHRPTRYALCQEKYIDIDMINAHPSILASLCHNNGISCPRLDEYVKDSKYIREFYAKEYGCSTEDIKTLFLILIYGGSYQKWIKDTGLDYEIQYITELDHEYRFIREQIYRKNDDLRVLALSCDEDKWSNECDTINGVMSLYCLSIERYIQELSIAYLTATSPSILLEHIIPCQDGFMVLKSEFDEVITPLESISTHIKKSINLDIKFAIKPFENPLHIPTLPNYRRLSYTELYYKCIETVTGVINTPTDFDLANYVYNEIGVTLKCIDVENDEWSVYLKDDKLWSNNTSEVRLMLSTNIFEKFETIRKNLLSLQNQHKSMGDNKPELVISEDDKKLIASMNISSKKEFLKMKEDEHEKELIKSNNPCIIFERTDALVNKAIKNITDITIKLKTTREKKNIKFELADICLDINFNSKLNNMKNHIPIKGGKILNLLTLDSRDRTPEDYFSYECPVSYKLLNADEYEYIDNYFMSLFCKDRELTTCFINIIKTMVSGHKLRYIFFMTGDGCNGKSVLLELIQVIFGKAVDTISNSVILQDKQNSSGINTEIEKLDKIRVGVISELKSGMKLNEDTIKTISGGDRMDLRALHRTNKTIIPTANILVACNQLADFNVSKAMVDRVRVIPFKAFFEVNSEFQNIMLTKVDDIFSYIMQKGVVQIGKLTFPEAMNVASAEYVEDNNNDILKDFFYGNYEITDTNQIGTNRIKRDEFIASYQYWLKSINRKPDTRSMKYYTKAVASYGVKVEQKHNIYYYTNVLLKSQNEEDL